MRSIADINPKKILLIVPNWVGDLAMATPAIRCVRENFPEAFISVVVKRWLEDVLDGSPRFDEMILYDVKGEHAGLGGFWRFTRSLKKKNFDLAIVFPHSSRAGWLARCSGAPRRVGYNRGDRWFLLTDYVPPPREGAHWLPVPKTLYYLNLCAEAGLKVRSEQPELFCRDEDHETADALLKQHNVGPRNRLVLVTPGANFGSSKCWMPERFAEVCDLLAERYGARIGLVCGPGEEPIVESILEFAKTKPINFTKNILPLGTLKAFVQRCDLMVTNDTGPRHFGVAFEKPVVVIMGSTDPRHTASNLDGQIVVREDVPCGPCHKQICPTDHICMKQITVDMVMDAVEKLTSRYWK